ncbi:MAG: PQQ-binding-like beta-propeller repeat protein [Ignavibacteriaceae bacterium]|nr:PQQ-binding-like beta-propeller repeat protein [Ignavibacteriaceae bacterium]
MKFNLLFLFIIICTSLFYGQEYNYAVISDIQIGSPNSEQQLNKIVNNINSRPEIKFVVVIGNATRDGNEDEFHSAKKILDKLNIDYYPVSGFNDMKSGSSGGSLAKELWEDDKFVLEADSSSKHIGINNFSPWRNKGHFSVEDLMWLDTVAAETNSSEEVYFYSSVPLSEKYIGNWYEIRNRLGTKSWQAVFYPSSQNKITTGIVPPNIEIKPSVTKDNNWNYTLINHRPDTLFFYEITYDTLQTLWGTLSKSDTLHSSPVDSSGFINYAADIIWQKDLQKEMYAPALITEDKIFTASFSGDINCFDIEGNLLWTHNLERNVLNGMAREKDLLFIGTYEGDLFSLNANTGQVVQVIGIGEPITSQLVLGNIHYNDTDTKGLIACTSEGSVYFYEIYSFELIWQKNISQEMINTKPLVLKDKILFTSRDGTLYNIDLNSGVLNWKWSSKSTGYLSSPVTNGKLVFVSSTDRYVTAVDLLQGTTAWRKNDNRATESLNIANDNRKLLIKSISDYFVIADAVTGKGEKKIKCLFGTDNDQSDIIQLNDRYLFGAGNGIVYMIDKNFKCSPLFYSGNSRITTLQRTGDNLFTAANCDGRIILFKLKQD